MTTGIQDDTERRAREGTPSVRQRERSSMWTFVAAVALLTTLTVGVVVLLGQFVPTLPNPFATDRVDRTGPAVLQALEDLSEYRSATGHFQVVLDVEDDARYLPSAIAGERTLFVAVGTVDATVDFSALDEDAVRVSDDRTQASIVLPSPHLSEPHIDTEDSYVYARRRGLLNRIGGMFSDDIGSERQLYLLAEDRLRAAATDTNLIEVAERNTRAMLQTLLGSLGFTEVDVSFR